MIVPVRQLENRLPTAKQYRTSLAPHITPPHGHLLSGCYNPREQGYSGRVADLSRLEHPMMPPTVNAWEQGYSGRVADLSRLEHPMMPPTAVSLECGLERELVMMPLWGSWAPVLYCSAQCG